MRASVFSNGMIANLNVSRVAPARAQDTLLPARALHLGRLRGAPNPRFIARARRGRPAPAFPIISAEQIDLGEADPLADEVASFVASVRNRTVPAVTARDGLRVIELIERIRISMEQP